MLQMTIVITGLDKAVDKLEGFGRGLDDMRRAFKEIAENETSYFANEAFRSRGGVFQTRWPALSERYLAAKRRMWGNKPIMVASGKMEGRFYGEYTRNSATMGNRSKYFKYHQSNRKRKVIPRRKMIGVNSRVQLIARLAIQKEINRKMRAS
jgi:hypothetical protein